MFDLKVILEQLIERFWVLEYVYDTKRPKLQFFQWTKL